MSEPLVGIVILNWNGLELTKACLKSLERQSYSNTFITIVDNGSSDGSVKWLSNKTTVHPIENRKNRGFAKALNQGINACLKKDCTYIVSLNNDTTLDKDWLKQLVRYLEKNPKTDFAQGSSMQSKKTDIYDSSGVYIDRGFIPYQRGLNKKDPETTIKAIGPNAAGSIYRSTMLRSISYKGKEYFDEQFFAYVEDVDFNLRATLRGHKFSFIPEALLYHVGSATGEKVSKRKMFWGSRNLIWLVFKNVPFSVMKKHARYIIKAHLANLQFLSREQKSNFLPYLFGLVTGIVGIPLFWKKRRENLKLQKLSNDALLDLLAHSSPPFTNPFRKVLNLLK